MTHTKGKKGKDNQFEYGGCTFEFTLDKSGLDVFSSKEYQEFRLVDDEDSPIPLHECDEDERRTAFTLVMALNGWQPKDLTYPKL